MIVNNVLRSCKVSKTARNCYLKKSPEKHQNSTSLYHTKCAHISSCNNVWQNTEYFRGIYIVVGKNLFVLCEY
jgi:hypothetical protein